MPEYDIRKVDGFEKLQSRIEGAESIRDWSFILSDYFTFGNSKISDTVGIFNLNSATDCPNAETENCQVDYEDCYANFSEKVYPNTLAYRRRQEYLWDCLDAHTFAAAFREFVSRKRKKVSAIRFSQSGDVRHRGDIIKMDRIAELLPEYDVYVYSASNYLDWSEAEHFTVNQSNTFEQYGDRLYSAVSDSENIPDGAIECPHSYQKRKGSDDPIKCGDCRACIDKDGPDVYITLH